MTPKPPPWGKGSKAARAHSAPAPLALKAPPPLSSGLPSPTLLPQYLLPGGWASQTAALLCRREENAEGVQSRGSGEQAPPAVPLQHLPSTLTGHPNFGCGVSPGRCHGQTLLPPPPCFFGKSCFRPGLGLWRGRGVTAKKAVCCPTCGGWRTRGVGSPGEKQPLHLCTSAPCTASPAGNAGWGSPAPLSHQPQHRNTVHRQGEIPLEREAKREAR